MLERKRLGLRTSVAKSPGIHQVPSCRKTFELTFSFGPFRLLPTQRLLLEDDQPVRLGSRALDILLALVERPGQLVSKRELMARVWPDLVVVEANLTVHVAALRRALRDGRARNRYLINIPGQGYCFVAPVIVMDDPTTFSANHTSAYQAAQFSGADDPDDGLLRHFARR